MKQISDLSDIISDIKGASVERPNKVGTLSGHAAGEHGMEYELLQQRLKEANNERPVTDYKAE